MTKRNIKIIIISILFLTVTILPFLSFATTTVNTGSVDLNEVAGEATLHGSVASDSEILVNASFRFDTVNYVGGCVSMNWVAENFTSLARNQFEKKVSVQPNKTYYYCATGFFHNPTTGEYHAQYGEVKSFTTGTTVPPTNPSVRTDNATNITRTSATANSFIDPKNNIGLGFFRYMKTATFGTPVIPSNCASSWAQEPALAQSISIARNFSVELTNLPEGKKVYYCPVFQYWPSGFGSAFEIQGPMKIFETLPPPQPGYIESVATHSPPTEIKDFSVVLSGSANPGGNSNLPAVGYFRYSTAEKPPVFCNDIYGSDMKSTNQISLGSGNVPMTFTTKVTGLEPSTTYYYCAIASNKDVIKYGTVKQFTTMPYIYSASPLMGIKTKNALIQNSNSAYLNGEYSTNVSAETWFEYRKIIPPIPGFGGNITPGTILNDLGMEILDFGDLEQAGIVTQQNELLLWGEQQKNDNGNNPEVGEAVVTEISASESRGWIIVGNQNKTTGSGTINYSLKNLSADTEYEFRAVIKGTTNTSTPVRGDTLIFKTKPENIPTPTPDLCPNNPGVQTTLPCPTTPIPTPIPCTVDCPNNGGVAFGTVTVFVNPSIPAKAQNSVNPLTLKANGLTGSTTVISGNALTLSSIGTIPFLETGRDAESGSGIAGGDWSGNKVCPSTAGTSVVYPSFILTNPFTNKSITKTFNLTCNKTSGGSITSDKTVVNISPNVPVSPAELTIKANGAFAPIYINSGESVTLSAHGANFVTDSGKAGRDWSGNKLCPTSIDSPIEYPSFTLVNPSTTTVMAKTYVLTCNRTAGPWVPPPTPTLFPTVSVTATPSTIKPGETSTISWTSTNATSCTPSIRAGMGTTGNNVNTTTGSFSTGALTSGKAYSVTCTGENGSASGNAYVFIGTNTSAVCSDNLDNDKDGETDINDPNCHVNGNLDEGWVPTHFSESISPLGLINFPTVNVTATPSTIKSGETSTISWTSTNTTSCSAGIPYASGTTGTFSTGILQTNKSYSVICTGENGSISGTTVVFVQSATDPNVT
ncbi:hypothetical protein M0R04_16160, partial [Candidatus Dojkabacteria bacterium]|nr:hypothetical protein [Candidatus Dojkabacteria bacterium]